MHETRQYAEEEIVIRHGVMRVGSGYVPVLRVNNGRLRVQRWAEVSLDEAIIESREFAQEEAAMWTGDWRLTVIDVGSVEPRVQREGGVG